MISPKYIQFDVRHGVYVTLYDDVILTFDINNNKYKKTKLKQSNINGSVIICVKNKKI